MQIKTTSRVHPNPIRVVKIKKHTNKQKYQRTNAGIDIRVKNTYSWIMGAQIGAATTETAVKISQKAENRCKT